MLLNLHVKNLALIHETEVSFNPGLNVLSGETGAGKSLIIGSVNLALGEKLPKDVLRKNAEYAFVELVFRIEDKGLEEKLKELDIFPEDGELILSRKIMANGRSVCRINSETVSATGLRKVASLLIDIHGQHEHQTLLAKKNHLKYLDSFAKKLLADKLQLLASKYQAYTECRKELEAFSADTEQQKRELSLLTYEINEIEEAGLIPDEDSELEANYQKLLHGQKIIEALSECHELCGEAAGNAQDSVGRGVRELLAVAVYDPSLSDVLSQLQEIENLLNDFNRDISGMLSDMDFSEESFQKIQDRLNLINHLKSKYGTSIEKILSEKERKTGQAEKLLHFDEYRKELEQKKNSLEADLTELSGAVSEIRKKQASILVERITKALKDLNFLDVRFDMEFSKSLHFSEKGWDEARFLVSLNPGEPMKPLDAVASGGELSRIMLALKTVLAESDDIDTLIFDEIDSGISGRTAQMVAEKLKLTGKTHQIICITHLPQIAAMADTHFLIEKTAEQDETVSSVKQLNDKDSVVELARMLGGVKITEAVLKNAEEMKSMAETLRGD